MSGLDAADAEILALAGGGESSDEEEVNQESIDDGGAGHTDSDEADAAIATAPTPKKKRIGRRKRNASEDEGEASEAESPVVDQPEPEPLQGPAGGILYGYEGIYESAREKALIEAMPELDREEILAKRREEIDNRRLEQQLLQRRTADSKRKAAGEDDEDSQKKRKLPGGRTSTALENYKATRERKGQRQTLTVEDARKDRDVSEDISRGEDSDVEWDAGKDRGDSQYDEPATHTDIYRAQARRTLMADHAFKTGFNKCITGCYVRIAIPPLPGSQRPTYKVAKVESVREDGKPHEVTDSRGTKFLLTKMLMTSVGKKKTEFPTVNCSDTKISLNEFEEYKAALEAAGLPLPKKSTLLKKNRDLLDMEAYQMTQKEIEERLQKTGIAGRKEKEIKIQILRRELASARAMQDQNTATKLETELRELGVKITTSPSSSQSPSKLDLPRTDQERLAEFNRKARRENAENVKRAQLNEARRKDKLRAEAKAKAVAAAKGSQEVESNGVNGHTSQTLASLLNGDHDNDEPEAGKIDFRRFDAVWQFGTLSKNKGGKKSVFRRTLFRSEMIGALDIKIDTSNLGIDLD